MPEQIAVPVELVRQIRQLPDQYFRRTLLLFICINPLNTKIRNAGNTPTTESLHLYVCELSHEERRIFEAINNVALYKPSR